MTKKSNFKMFTVFVLVLLLIVSSISPALAAPATQPAARDGIVVGKFIVEPPTLISLGFEWYIEGDDNHNAVVDVTYRKVGDTEWKTALPMLRIMNEHSIYDFGTSLLKYNYRCPNLFAGSIFDLEEDTSYECKFVMSDPDGIQGTTTQTVTVKTRPEPMPYEGGAVYHVYPQGYTGPKESPNFLNLMQAYYTGYAVSDWSNFSPPRVKAGDTILVHAGTYVDDQFAYGQDLRGLGNGTPFDGTYYLTADGTAEKPIVIKAAGDGEVIFDGNGCQNLFNVMGGDYNYFEGLTIQNTQVAFMAGLKDITGSSGLTVKDCLIQDVGIGVFSDWSGSKDFYIADNAIIGRENQNMLVGWYGNIGSGVEDSGYPARLDSYIGIKLYGSGHVACYNYVANFHDGIDIATYGLPDGYYDGEIIRDRMCVAIDFYNNEIYNMADNFIETDGAMYNVRVLRNRGLNVAGQPLSMQPVLGGPVYFVRNTVYHAPNGGSLKLVCDPAGGLFYNNTFGAQVSAAVSSNMHFRNNLFLYENPSAYIFSATQQTNYSTSNYNGFALSPNGSSGNHFQWNTPAFDIMFDFTGGTGSWPNGSRVTRNYRTLADYSEATGQDKNSILVTWDDLVNAQAPGFGNVEKTYLYKTQEFDFRLKPDSAAVDAGTFIPNVTEGFNGTAPDLGSYEVGAEMPVYGPRTGFVLDVSKVEFFDVDGETLLATQFVNDNNNKVLDRRRVPTITVEDGKELVGWAIAGTTTLVDLTQPITGDLQLVPFIGEPTVLRVKTDAHMVKTGDYFRVTPYFTREIKSNTAVMSLVFDPNKFEYRGFTPADGVTVLNTIVSSGNLQITVMVDDYKSLEYGEVLFSAKDDADLKNEDNEITVAVQYVVLQENGTKVIKSEVASTIFSTWIGEDGPVTLIELSNLIDVFGMTSADPKWPDFKFYDYNNNQEIDISDISELAKKIVL